jgi:hypothetical protein
VRIMLHLNSELSFIFYHYHLQAYHQKCITELRIWLVLHHARKLSTASMK